MKKLCMLASLILFGTASFIQAQSIEIYDSKNKEKAFKNGDTIELMVSEYGKGMENILVAPKNIGLNTISVNAKQTVLNRIDGNLYSFCWGSCYEDNFETTMTGDPDLAVSIEGNSFSDEICIFDFTANNPGITYVRYTFFDQDNINDSACIILKYNDEHVGISNVVPNSVQMNVFPNPCSGSARISWESEGMTDMRIKVCNILGVCVFEQDITGNSLNLHVSDWTNGIYFYTLYSGNQSLGTQKLIVKH